MMMDADTVLEVDGVHKLYSRSYAGTQERLSKVLLAAVMGRDFTVADTGESEFWALKNINLTVKRGESLGIIGFNGAGKTTLLRMLNGQLPPDRGEIRIAGKTASMIDLTAGLNDRMSGWENIYLRSASIGKTRQEVDTVLDEMVDFMELGDALQAPIQTYSAGMRMRLAFATTIFVNPDLLLIDEVLSVGDFRFRQKCLERIRSLREKCAFVLATHSMRDVSQFCTETIVLQKGEIAFQGAPDDAIKFFQESEAATAPAKPIARKALGEFIRNESSLTEVKVAINGEVRKADDDPLKLARGSKLAVKVSVTAGLALTDIWIGYPIFDHKENMMSAYSSQEALTGVRADPGEQRVFELVIDTASLNPGVYQPVVIVKEGAEFLYRQKAPALEIEDPDRIFHWGPVTLPHEWSVS
ncbi:MAG: polysaccharide ABC transporter ATP-binding protein [Pseudomonadota bacterium]